MRLLSFRTLEQLSGLLRYSSFVRQYIDELISTKGYAALPAYEEWSLTEWVHPGT